MPTTQNTPTIQAARTAPSEWALASTRIATGDTFADNAQRYQVIGQPIHVGHCLVNVRVRELDGRHAGNEFGAYLYTR